MNTNLKALAAVVLATVVGVGYAQTTAGSSHQTSAKKVHRKTAEKKPSVESQIEALRRDLNSQRTQIDSLKQQLTDRDAQLQQAQQAAQQAQQTAQAAQQAANQQQQQLSDNAAQVSSLQGSVSDLKTNTASIVGTIQEDQTTVKKAIESPDAIHFKGITISPTGSFIEAATVNRSAATGGDINTPFTGVPLDHSEQGQISEFYGSARQSRIAIKAVGKLPNMTLTGYYELDWLGTGITSNNNQSNSYVVRQRQLWAQAALNSGWTFTGGQMWSLATETSQGMSNGSEILPGTIDPQYTAGFVWARQYGFRVSKNFNNKFWLGASVENAETLNPAGSNLPTNEEAGSGGTGGGLYNSTANYSFNLAPDMVAKAVWEPGLGHYELFGVARFFRNRVYPSTTSAIGAYNDSTVGGGVGGSLRVPLAQKKLSVGLKGLWGQGVGRYGDSTIADVTLRPDGQIAPLRAFSALSTIEASPTARLSLYFNYGGDYVYRRYFGNEGYGSPLTDMSGCRTEPVPGASATNGANSGFTPGSVANCGNQNKDVQEFTSGYWYNFYNGPKGRLRQGIQYSYFRRDLWSGTATGKGAGNPGGGAQGTDHVVETSLRYYLP